MDTMRWTVIIGVVVVLWVLGLGLMQLRKIAQVTMRKGERVLKQARGVTARINCDQQLSPGLRTNVTNQRQVLAVLTDQRLALATWRGVMVDLAPGDQLRVAAAGPKRLVIEGERKARSTAGKTAQLRIELLVEDTEAWAVATRGMLGA